jgi:sugar lactone lactonase YvrE
VIRNEKIFSVVNESDNLKYIAPAPLVFAALNPTGTRLATVTADRKSLQVTNSSESNFGVVAQGDQISKPTWDRDGNIYFSDAGQGVRVVLSDGRLRPVAVDVSTLGTNDQVKQVAIASDGVRVAVVLSDGIQDVVAVGAIFKTDSETRIIGLHRIERSIISVRDIVWSSPTSVAVVGSDVSKSELLFDVSLLDGKTRLFSTPVGAQQIFVDGAGNIFVSAVDGTNQIVFQQSFGSWTQVTSGIGGFFSN